MPKTPLKPRKTPRQQRSEEMVESILEAAARVLDRHPLEAFTTNRVAEVAGVSVGSLYQYFPNKDALTAQLIARAQRELQAAVAGLEAELAAASLEEGVRLLVRMALRHQFERPRLAAALDLAERRLPVGEVLAASDAALRAAVRGFLERHRAEIAWSDLDACTADLMVLGRALIEAHLEGAEPAPDLERRVMRTLLGYLKAPEV